MVIIGADELAEGKVKLRDMASHEETLVALEAVVDEVRARL